MVFFPISFISFWALIASEKKLLQFGWRKKNHLLQWAAFLSAFTHRESLLSRWLCFLGGHWSVTERIAFLMDTLIRLVRSDSALTSCVLVTLNKKKMTPLKSYNASCLPYVNICKYSESKWARKWLLRPAVPLKQDKVVEQTSSLLLPLRHYVYMWPICEADLLSTLPHGPILILVCECQMIFLPAPWWQSGVVARIKPFFKCISEWCSTDVGLTVPSRLTWLINPHPPLRGYKDLKVNFKRHKVFTCTILAVLPM